MKKFILIIIILMCLIAIIMITNYASVVGHEDAHVQINKYGGASSNTTISFDTSGIKGLTTVDANSRFYSEEDRRNAYLAHGINEAIGYQLIPFLNGIMLLLSALIVIVIINNLEDD